MATLAGAEQFVIDYQLSLDDFHVLYDSQEIEFYYENYLKWNSYARLSDITGVAVAYDQGGDLAYIWITISSRPYDIHAPYEMVFSPEIGLKKRKRRIARIKAKQANRSK